MGCGSGSHDSRSCQHRRRSSLLRGWNCLRAVKTPCLTERAVTAIGTGAGGNRRAPKLLARASFLKHCVAQECQPCPRASTLKPVLGIYSREREVCARRIGHHAKGMHHGVPRQPRRVVGPVTTDTRHYGGDGTRTVVVVSGLSMQSEMLGNMPMRVKPIYYVSLLYTTSHSRDDK